MSRPRVALLVTDRRLMPAWTGNRVRILGVVRALRAQGLRVVVIGAQDPSLHDVRPLVDGVIAVRARPFQGGPIAAFDPRPFRRAVDRVARRFEPEVAIAEYAWLAPALSGLPRGTRRWVDCHDVLHERCARFQAAGLDPWTVCTLEEEVERLRTADVLIVSQHRDEELLGSLLPHREVVTLLPEIPLPDGYRPAAAGGRTVLAVGSAQPGNEMVREFARVGWPRVLSRVPDARLRVIGAVGEGLAGLEGVDAPGDVDDLAGEYARAAAVVCPVAVGSGVKVKLLEALRLGRPTVATPLASEGLPRATLAWAEAESVAGCADAVAGLLLAPASAAALGRAAFAFGERHLSATAASACLRPLLESPSATRASRVRGLPVASASVIVPATSWSDPLRACIESLQAQRVEQPVEIVVVMNGADPPAERTLPGVSVVHEPRRGPAAARNAGVRASSGDVLAFVDSDCVARPGWLASGLATMRTGAPGGIVAGAIVRPDAGRNPVSLYDSVTYLQQERYVNGPGAFVTANLLVHRRTFERVGPFDASFEEAAFEDWEWALRARRAGLPITYEAAAAVEHPCMTTLDELRQKAERLARGRLVMHRKLGEDAEALTLTESVWSHARRALREERVARGDRLRVAGVGSLVGFWAWSTDREQRRLHDRADRRG